MKLLIQKVKNLKIRDSKKVVLDLSYENFCLLFYVGIERGDENKNLKEIVKKIENLQIIDNEEGKFKLSISSIKPTIVFVSQITLLADFNKSRINFNQSLEQNLAKETFDRFYQEWKNMNYNVYKTEFGSYLMIESINLGPINFCLSL